MKKFGVTGNPILHSLSPKLFNAAYNSDYIYLRLIAKTAGEALKLFHELDLSGMNVTAPFKDVQLWGEGVMSREVEILGMTNTILKEGGQLKFYNTDIDGVGYKLPNVKGLRCVVLGAGGAGKTAAYLLRQRGAEVTIANRTVSRAAAVAQKFDCTYCDLRLIPKAEIIVNTLHEKVMEIGSDQRLVDAIYHHSPYENQYATGLDWLLGQALSAYRLFTGEEPNLEAMSKIDSTIPTTIRFVGNRSEELTRMFPQEMIGEDGMELWLYDGKSDFSKTAWAVIDATTKTNKEIYEEICKAF